MVDRAAKTIDAVVTAPARFVQPIGADAPEITARFRDPAGNVLGCTSNQRERTVGPAEDRPRRRLHSRRRLDFFLQHSFGRILVG